MRNFVVRRGSIVSAALMCLVATAPTHAALVWFRISGSIDGVFPVAFPDVTIGTPMEVSLLVDTECVPYNVTFSDAPDSRLLQIGSTDTPYRSVRVRIGHHTLRARSAEGQLFIEGTEISLPGLELTMLVFADDRRHGEFNTFLPTLLHSDPVFRDQVDEADVLGSVLPLFDAGGPFSAAVAGSDIGSYSFFPQEVSVRVVRRISHGGARCGPQGSIPEEVSLEDGL